MIENRIFLEVSEMNRTQTTSIVLLSFILCFWVAGCGNKFFDPTQVGRFRPMPAVNVILDSLGVAEETPVAWENGEDPRPGDVIAYETDYTFRSGDIVRVSIFELLQEGGTYVDDYVVTETGKVTIPEVGVVQVAGLTETQFEEEIRQILSPSILKDPSVVVVLLSSQQRTFSILGNGIPAPSRYIIPRYNFRLTDALAMAGGPAQFNVSFIYVSRFEKGQQYEGGQIESVMPELEMAEPVGPELELETVEPETGEPVGPEFELETIGPAEPELEMPEIEAPGLDMPELELPELELPELEEQPVEPEREMMELIAPRAQHQWPASKVVISTAEMVTGKELSAMATPGRSNRRTRSWSELEAMLKKTKVSTRTVTANEQGNLNDILMEPADAGSGLGSGLGDIGTKWIFKDGKWVPVQEEEPKPEKTAPVEPEVVEEVKRPKPVRQAAAAIPEPVAAETEAGHIEWIFKDGKWVPVQIGEAKAVGPEIGKAEGIPEFGPEPVLPGFEWEERVKSRLIKIPADKLLSGDPQYNIIIKPGDSIYVPVDIIGEFCVMGNVNRQGYINITGRPMTLKMAIAAAGGLGPLAWPKKVEVVRRIGRKKEEIVQVDLDKIAAGEQPDFFIKPNDLINVGTHATSTWRAVLRNAFRATYGFGFIYDRNFADRDYGGRPLPKWF